VVSLFAAGGYITTNITLASIAFVLIGMFVIFVAMALYVTVRLMQKKDIIRARI